MGLIEFVRNHDDLSTDRGYQFKFHCDKCGSGWISEFETSITGTGGAMLRAAGNIFGGIFNRAAAGEAEMRRMVQGKGHDDAFRKAVEAGKQKFKKCTRCGKWVCPESCWNDSKGLCEECAPDLREEAAAAQAQAARQQVIEKAGKIDQTKGLDLAADVALTCPQCKAKVQGGKFCPECGANVAATAKCAKCGSDLKAGAKFCPECGQKTA